MRLKGLELTGPIFLSTLAGFLGDGYNGVPVDRRVAESLAEIGLKVRKGGLLFATAVAEVGAPGPILVHRSERGPQVLREFGPDQTGHVPIVEVVAELHLPKPLPKFSIVVAGLEGGEPVQEFHGITRG
ncbi:hypothetical protein chiPu_0026452 [Chiloscyllium punctatum]|uniref:Uncharacterized protein n=1 Tax=Chiloscyllium punctatum TaxID=137246 RepID=A0A401THV5_CHIPU|nr:hypothetical protein [Chiloscyllium punctatum]